jgi:2,4-didehydro-3-deoxy-L-rhamnonate hydrolase
VRLGMVDGRATLVTDGASLDIAQASGGRWGPGMISLLEDWQRFTGWAATVRPDGPPAEGSQLGNPLPWPRQVIGVGLNYRRHAEEVGVPVPKTPLIFTKFPSCLAGPSDTITLPSQSVDWEVELAVVIGRRCHQVDDTDAWDHVAGITAGQDITDRGVQMAGSQLCLSKSFTGFGPLGPVMVTLDEVGDRDDIGLGCAVDGVAVQQARTSDLVFAVPELLARLSRVFPLMPGDVIFTGTPAGVGVSRKPPRFLQPGEVLTSWVEGVGELRNPVVAGPGHPALNELHGQRPGLTERINDDHSRLHFC